MTYDAERTRILEGYGLKVIRFTNDEVLHNFEAVCDYIEGSIFLRGTAGGSHYLLTKGLKSMVIPTA